VRIHPRGTGLGGGQRGGCDEPPRADCGQETDCTYPRHDLDRSYVRAKSDQTKKTSLRCCTPLFPIGRSHNSSRPPYILPHKQAASVPNTRPSPATTNRPTTQHPKQRNCRKGVVHVDDASDDASVIDGVETSAQQQHSGSSHQEFCLLHHVSKCQPQGVQPAECIASIVQRTVIESNGDRLAGSTNGTSRNGPRTSPSFRRSIHRFLADTALGNAVADVRTVTQVSSTSPSSPVGSLTVRIYA